MKIQAKEVLEIANIATPLFAVWSVVAYDREIRGFEMADKAIINPINTRAKLLCF